jgi:hypothetical protein
MTQTQQSRRKEGYKKPPNGQAHSGSYLLVFDLDDPAQAKAWKMAQELAAGRKLKHVLVGLLLALYNVQQATGKALDMTEFLARFVVGMVRTPVTDSPKSIEEARTSVVLEVPNLAPNSEIFKQKSAKESITAARSAFAGGMGNLFDDD